MRIGEQWLNVVDVRAVELPVHKATMQATDFSMCAVPSGVYQRLASHIYSNNGINSKAFTPKHEEHRLILTAPLNPLHFNQILQLLMKPCLPNRTPGRPPPLSAKTHRRRQPLIKRIPRLLALALIQRVLQRRHATIIAIVRRGFRAAAVPHPPRLRRRPDRQPAAEGARLGAAALATSAEPREQRF